MLTAGLFCLVTMQKGVCSMSTRGRLLGGASFGNEAAVDVLESPPAAIA